MLQTWGCLQIIFCFDGFILVSNILCIFILALIFFIIVFSFSKSLMLIHFPTIPLAVSVYLQKGGCQDPGVDLDLKVTVTLQGKVKAPLSG